MRCFKEIGKQAVWSVCGMLLLAALAAGCATTAGSSALKVSSYTPDESGRDVWKWGSDEAGSGTSPTLLVTNGFTRALKKGDKVKISLTGIPRPQEIENVVNDFGLITLPLIGSVKIEGLTTAKAESLVRKTYIDKQFYRSIDVIIVAQEGEFYVRGEVKKPGSFPMSGDVTLVQGIIMAGGYTEYHKKKAIELRRGRKTMIYNAEKIEKGELEDPILKNGDIIVVPQRVW